MKFKNKQHEDFYVKNIQKTNSERDPYRKALFYTLGLAEQTRTNINDIYDFAESEIDFACLSKPWQTSTSLRVTRLSFNLYNNFNGIVSDEVIDNPKGYTPEDIFCNELMPYFFEAIKLRYPEYVRKET